jgi:hypothetical protein
MHTKAQNKKIREKITSKEWRLLGCYAVWLL